ncbi:hypothetical protein LINPERPRIM_LOCUS14319, partial [Linum perenne]
MAIPAGIHPCFVLFRFFSGRQINSTKGNVVVSTRTWRTIRPQYLGKLQLHPPLGLLV